VRLAPEKRPYLPMSRTDAWQAVAMTSVPEESFVVLRQAVSTDGVVARLCVRELDAVGILDVRFAREGLEDWYTDRDLDFPFADLDDFVKTGAAFYGLDLDEDASETDVLLFGAVGNGVGDEVWAMLHREVGLTAGDADAAGLVLVWRPRASTNVA